MVFIISVEGKQKLPYGVFVRYKMNGCSHCINSQPEWDKACDRIKNNYNKNRNLGMIEIESSFEHLFDFLDEDGTRYTSSGYPEHVIFINGRKVHTCNDRTADSFVEAFKHHLYNLKRVKSKLNSKRIIPVDRNQLNNKVLYFNVQGGRRKSRRRKRSKRR